MKRHSTASTGAATAPIGAPALRVSAGVVATVLDEARRAWPHECCGLLAGVERPDAGCPDAAGGGEGSPGGRRDHAGRPERRVVRAVPVPNGAEDAARGYRIPAAVLRRLEAELAADGLEVVGVYHSHPDGRARPSAADGAAAWPWYSYLIVPLAEGGEVGAAGLRSWRLREDRSGFGEERLEVERGGGA